MGVSTAGNLTRLLNGIPASDSQEREELAVLVHAELRKIAARMMSSEQPGHTLEATLLADDAYMHLLGGTGRNWHNRAHFFATAASAMRQILVDHSRRKRAQKRGGPNPRLDDQPDRVAAAIQDPETVLAIDQALTRLAKKDARQAQIVELRYFGGFTEEEIADIWNLSPRSVRREWASARAWLYAELTAAPPAHRKA
jgi:RNA polymerase sigma factor (TIGR02999 family)